MAGPELLARDAAIPPARDSLPESRAKSVYVVSVFMVPFYLHTQKRPLGPLAISEATAALGANLAHLASQHRRAAELQHGSARAPPTHEPLGRCDRACRR